jgi:hypothetical protein
LVLYTLLAFSLMTIRPMPPAMDLFLCANLRVSCVSCGRDDAMLGQRRWR